MKIENLKFKIVFFSAYLFLLSILPTVNYQLPTVHAQSLCPPTSLSIRSISGLITTPKTLNTKFSSQTGTCIFDPKSSFAPFKIPTFDDLKSLYFTQAKTIPGVVTTNDLLPDGSTQSSIPFGSVADPSDQIYFVNGSLNITGNNSGTKSGIIFVEGNLNITGDYTYGSGTTGTVFIVKGNINISTSVTRVDAVLMSQGADGYSICTAYESSCLTGYTDPLTTQKLTVNGSLISLNTNNPVRFRRSVGQNTEAAEEVNQQPKYLVLLRNILSEKLRKWSEVTEDKVL